jgi:hypothetical protein
MLCHWYPPRFCIRIPQLWQLFNAYTNLDAIALRA